MPKPFPVSLYHILRCPIDHLELSSHETHFFCETCGSRFPICGGVPLLIDRATSLFTGIIAPDWDPSSVRHVRFNRTKMALRWLRPSNSTNLAARHNYEELTKLALRQSTSPLVLIVGGAEIGKGLSTLLNDPRFTFVESDVYLGRRVNIIADGHRLPFKDKCFDAVICQAVLQHVADPAKCVSELWRVLIPNGVVYCEVPFMQQVHGGAYDFTRFSLTGCRRLFRNFDEQSAGMVAGPGTALAWSIEYFVRSFSTSANWHMISRSVMPFFIFWIKYFDYLFDHIQSAQDAASCVFFLGRKRDKELSDCNIVGKYWSLKEGNTSPQPFGLGR